MVDRSLTSDLSGRFGGGGFRPMRPRLDSRKHIVQNLVMEEMKVMFGNFAPSPSLQHLPSIKPPAQVGEDHQVIVIRI